MTFTNSADFLSYLQTIWENDDATVFDDEQEKWSEDFFQISKDRLTSIDPTKVSPGHQKNHYDELIRSYVNELGKGLTENQKVHLESKISIGSVNTNDINAVCTTDKNGNYAVVVNSSLFTYLHKYGKLLTALSNPSSVIYCNRKPHTELTKDDILEYIDILPKIYFEMDKVMGPMIHLNEQNTIVHMLILEMAEKFIIGHELGHYFKGHLDNSLNTELFLNQFEKLKNNNHTLEFEADDFGLELLQKSQDNSRPDEFNQMLINGGISLAFNGLNSLNPFASETHPAPIDRMNRLLKIA